MKLSIKDVLVILWKGMALIIIAAIVGALIAGAITFALISPEYTATAKMYVYNEKNDNQYITSGDLTVSKSLVDTYLIIIESNPVLEEVAVKLARTYPEITAHDIQEMISGSAINETEAFFISATCIDAQMAQDIVNTIIEIAPEEIIRVVKAASVEVIESAKLPTEPYWPIKRNMIIGFALGFFISIGYIIIATTVDSTVYGRNELVNNFKIPIIGAIPAFDEESKNNRRRKNLKRNDLYQTFGRKLLLNEKTPFSIAEAYRMARTNIFYLPIEESCKKIVITSAYAAEGKTITSINLAKLLSQTGKRVLLIDADLRKPRVGRYLDISSESGLSEYLAGLAPTVNIVKDGLTGADIITSGKPSSSAAELLATSRMGTLLKEKEPFYDFILIDTPPVNIVTDSTMLANKVNGYILAVRAEYSNVDGLKQVVNALEQVNATIYGMILSNTDPKVEAYGRYSRYGKYTNYGKYGEKYKYYTGSGAYDNEKNVANGKRKQK